MTTTGDLKNEWGALWHSHLQNIAEDHLRDLGADTGDVHPELLSRIKKFTGKMPPAGTLSAEGLRQLGAPETIITWAKKGVDPIWKHGVVPPPKSNAIGMQPV